jgi:hypothetical protein
MRSLVAKTPPKLVEYDSIRRRLWIFGQRCHHGSLGSIVAGLACVGLAAEPIAREHAPKSFPMIALVATGSVLMAHDWKDRTIWFERGYGTQP